MNKDDIKFLAAMPLQAKMLINEAIKSGETLIGWLGKLQGQIDYRLQSFFNTTEPIKDPKLVRFYIEIDDDIKFTTNVPTEYLTFKYPIPEEFMGQYILTICGIVGSSASGSPLLIEAVLNDRDILPTSLILRSPSEECRIPFTIKRLIKITEPLINIKVNLSCEKSGFGKGDVTGYYCSIELVKVD